MDEMPSSEFRKRYATLIASTVVTVNGHKIGLWVPLAEGISAVDVTLQTKPIQDMTGVTPEYLERQFSSRPFTPAPKTARR